MPGEEGKAGKVVSDCRLPHPAAARDCHPPYPSVTEPCPERRTLPQHQPTGVPTGKSCVECGRVTGRVYVGDALSWAVGVPVPWCGGALPAAPAEG